MKTTDRIATLALILSGVLLAAPASLAQKDPGTTVLISPDETEPSVRRGDLRVSALTGAPIALYRVGYPVDPGTPEDMARQYLRENHELLRLQHADLSDLRHHATREGKAATTVRFRQHVDGVPVYKAELTVTVNRDREVTFVMSTYKPVGPIHSTGAVRPPGEARTAALELLGVEGKLDFESTDLVVYYNRGVTRLAHRVKLVPRTAPLGDWEVLRDAHTGEIFKAVDTALYVPVDGDGDTFDPDPLSSALATYGDPGFVDGGDANTPELDGERMNRALLDIDFDGGLHHLRGPWAEITDHSGPFNGVFSQASPSWTYNRFDDPFEAANVYYHIDTYMRYMNLTLGVDVRPYQYPGGVQADPHGFNGADNSSYSSSTGRLRFGEGGVDDAEDADVVIHELGHGIHDWITMGGLSQVNGLSEGVGDYFAQSYSRSFGQWAPTDPAYHWVFNWDGHNPFWGGRITNYGATYPDGLVGQIHTDGQIWSTCNMRVWDAIGREQTDTAMLEGLAMTNSGTNQEDAAQACLQAATDLGYSGGDLAAMATIYQSCGYQVSIPGAIFLDGFESGDTSAWTTTTP